MKHSGPRLIALLLAACARSPSPPAAAPEPAPAPPVAVAPQATCEGTIARLMDVQGEAMVSQVRSDQQASWKATFADVMVTSCREDGWPQAVLDCVAAAPDSRALDACMKPLDEATLQKMTARLHPHAAAVMADMEAEPAPPSDPALAAWTSGPTGIAACDGYLFVVEAYAACAENRTPDTDAAVKNMLATMKESWAHLREPGAPAEKRQAAADSCQQISDAVRAQAAAASCAIPPAPSPAVIAAPSPEPAKKPAKTKKAKAKK
jgi:hypothetical protein